MPVMATEEPKRERGRPVGRTPKYNIHTGIDVEIGKALDAYMESFVYEPLLKDVAERALKMLLEKEGFWPPKKTKRKDD